MAALLNKGPAFCSEENLEISDVTTLLHLIYLKADYSAMRDRSSYAQSSLACAQRAKAYTGNAVPWKTLESCCRQLKALAVNTEKNIHISLSVTSKFFAAIIFKLHADRSTTGLCKATDIIARLHE